MNSFTAPVLGLLSLAATTFAADSPVADLEKKLTPIIKATFPDAKIEVTPTSFSAKHGTMEFMVHGRSMTGEVSAKYGPEEGPNYLGFMLHLSLEDGLYEGQAVTPQELQQPYWTAFLDSPALPGGRQHWMVHFSYGVRLDQAFKKAVFEALPKSR